LVISRFLRSSMALLRAAAVLPAPPQSAYLDSTRGSFAAFAEASGLDRRLLKAIARVGYAFPTRVQSQALPLALSGKDLLIRARTGSGKTAAYALAILQKLLVRKQAGGALGRAGGRPRRCVGGCAYATAAGG